MFGPEFDSLRLHNARKVPVYQALTKIDSKKRFIIDSKNAVIKKKPVLRDKQGDIAKRWAVEYTIFDLKTKQEKRILEWIPKRLSLEQRYVYGKKKIKEVLDKYEDRPIPNSVDIIQEILIEIVQNKNLREKSKSTYRTCVFQLCSFLKNSKITEINQIDSDLVYNFVKALVPVYHTNTAKNTINHLKAIFTEAHRQKIVENNPFKGLTLPFIHQDSDFNTPFSDYEKKLIEEYLIENNIPLYLFTRFVFYAYIRPKELINIKVGDVDLKTKTIKVKGEISKTKKSESIPLLKPLYNLIVEHQLLSNPSGFYLFGKGLKPSLKKLPINFATTEHAKVLKVLGLYRERETTLYAWKHTGNIHAYLNGMDIKTIQRINRHSNLATTEIYLRKLGLFLDKTVFDFSY
jgi:integrase